ncbi:hypothetical protein F5141DRAFT_1059265 [Pisolithus sp. B1]|nr:hypothetical protein F5141DRAFT_1059265 [Pisolithus sp. B1]
MDDAIVIPLATLQFSKERGYDVTVGNHVQVAHGPAVARHLTVLSEDGPWHDVPISSCVKLQDYSLRDIECQVGHEVWIISGPKKGYRGTLQLVGRTTCEVAIHSGIMQLKHTAVITKSGMLLSGIPLDPTQMVAFIELHWTSFIWTVLSPCHTTPPPSIADPSVEPGPSTSAYDPWVVHPDDVTSQHSNETEQQHVDYVSANVKHHFIPVRDLTPANPMSTGQSCLILWGKFTGQIHQVKRCQSKKVPKGVELEDGTKLLFRDVCQVITIHYHVGPLVFM